MRASEDQGVVLKGLDGGNPLAFLAAVGTLRTVVSANAEGGWRMKWRDKGGMWSPVLVAHEAPNADRLVELLVAALRCGPTPEFDIAENLNFSPADFKRVAAEAQLLASPREHRYADFVAAYGSEAVTTHDRKSIQDTALRTMSGAGHQHFLGTMKQLLEKTEAAHLHQALFETWDYADDRLGLRWDPEEDRRHALRWAKPSGEAPRTMWGANRLAVEALPLFPTAPSGRRLATTGFSMLDGRVLFSWPIWDAPLNLDVVRSLLALSAIQDPEPDRAVLHSMGVRDVYRSQRVTVGKYRNFTRSQPT